MEKLLITEQPLNKEEDQMRCGTLLCRTSELFHIPNSPHRGVKCSRAKAGVSSALSDQMNLWLGETRFALLPLLLKEQR